MEGRREIPVWLEVIDASRAVTGQEKSMEGDYRVRNKPQGWAGWRGWDEREPEPCKKAVERSGQMSGQMSGQAAQRA